MKWGKRNGGILLLKIALFLTFIFFYEKLWKSRSDFMPPTLFHIFFHIFVYVKVEKKTLDQRQILHAWSSFHQVSEHIFHRRNFSNYVNPSAALISYILIGWVSNNYFESCKCIHKFSQVWFIFCNSTMNCDNRHCGLKDSLRTPILPAKISWSKE